MVWTRAAERLIRVEWPTLSPQFNAPWGGTFTTCALTSRALFRVKHWDFTPLRGSGQNVWLQAFPANSAPRLLLHERRCREEGRRFQVAYDFICIMSPSSGQPIRAALCSTFATLSMSRAPLHKDLVALDRAHQAVMQQLASEQAAAWDEGKSEQNRVAILATVQRKLEMHMTQFQAEWTRMQARIEWQASVETHPTKQMEEGATTPP